MFPTINHINDLLPYIEGNSQFRVAEQPNGTTVICYMLQDEDTFRGEHEDWYKECRGITFDTSTGRVVARTLHKFQNVGENESTQPDLIPWNRIVRVMDKRDGSMITPVLLADGSIACKTKKTFTSAEALAANEFLKADPEKFLWVLKMLQNGYTPTFEWTSPRFPIVLTYDKDELTLLQIRDNTTGNYVVELDRHFGDDCPFPTVENVLGLFSEAKVTDAGIENLVSWEMLKRAAETRTGVEGWIIQADDGQMWKIKTKWYCDLHHSVTFTRYRDVARVVLEDKSDDLKAAFAMTGRSIQPIVDIENRINRELNIIQTAVELHAGNGRVLERTAKDMALALREHALFGLIMRAFRGQEVDYREWYVKNKLDENWSLEVIPTVTGEAA
jgi:RNA ligase